MKAIVATAILLIVVLSIHQYKNHYSERAVEIYALEKIERIRNPEAIKIEIWDEVRGDYLVSYFEPPFREMRWTLNKYSGDIIPWQKSPK